MKCKNCIFCQIVKGNKPGFVIYQDKETMALLDIFPSVEGHVIVIPKRHGRTIFDFQQQELGYLWKTVKKVIKGLEKTYKTKVFTVGINHMEEKGVPHLHIHVLPRQKDDKGGIIQTVVQVKIKEDLAIIKKKIKNNIN